MHVDAGRRNRVPARPAVHGSERGLQRREGADHVGELQAWNLRTGEQVWTHEFASPNWGPVLATGGGLVFSGGTTDRYFRAFDAATGKVLWQYRTNSGITGVPTSFEVDGTQYIAVQSGWGVDAQGMTRAHRPRARHEHDRAARRRRLGVRTRALAEFPAKVPAYVLKPRGDRVRRARMANALLFRLERNYAAYNKNKKHALNSLDVLRVLRRPRHWSCILPLVELRHS